MTEKKVKKVKKFYDYEIDDYRGVSYVRLFHKEKSKNIKDSFLLNDIIVPYLNKKGWEFVSDESDCD